MNSNPGRNSAPGSQPLAAHSGATQNGVVNGVLVGQSDSSRLESPGPVHMAIQAFGTIKELADILGVDRKTVRRWRDPAAHKHGGTGGDFPSPACIRKILAAAAERGIALDPLALLGVGRE